MLNPTKAYMCSTAFTQHQCSSGSDLDLVGTCGGKNNVRVYVLVLCNHYLNLRRKVIGIMECLMQLSYDSLQIYLWLFVHSFMRSFNMDFKAEMVQWDCFEELYS